MADKPTQGPQTPPRRAIIRKRVWVRFEAPCELTIVDSELCALQDWLRQYLNKEVNCRIVCPEEEPDTGRPGEGPSGGQTTNQNCESC